MRYTILLFFVLVVRMGNAQIKPGEFKYEMSTDRPDVTESAYSVEKGHFQIETDLFKTEKTKTSDFSTTNNFYNLMNFKYGLTESVDLQLVVESFVTQKTRLANGLSADNNKGLGDITLRVKKNIWGNKGGKTAFALMPYTTFGTSSTTKVAIPEIGIITPFAAELGENWGFGTQIQFSLAKENAAEPMQPSLLQSATISRTLSSKFDAFIETFYDANLNGGPINPYINGGLVFSPTGNLKFDIGTNIGLNNGTEKIYFLGFSMRY